MSHRWSTMLVPLALLAAACGGGGDDGAVADPPTTEPVPVADDPSPEPEEGTAEPDGPGAIEPIWAVDDVPGAISHIALRDGRAFVAAVTPEGTVIQAADLVAGTIEWVAEIPSGDLDAMAPDGDGGLVYASSTLLVALDGEGEERWSTTPLTSADDSPAAAITALDLDEEGVVVGSNAFGAAAEVGLDDGTTRWFLPQDETASPEATFLGAGDRVEVLDDGRALLLGGGATNFTTAAVDRADGSVAWSRYATTGAAEAVTEEVVVLRDSPTTLTALDLGSGDETWTVTDDGWEGEALSGGLRTAGDTLIIQFPRLLLGIDVGTGDERWRNEEPTEFPEWGSASGPVYDGDEGEQAVTLRNGELALVAADGTIRHAPFGEGPLGTFVDVAVEAEYALVASRGSTNREPSRLWLLDLSTLAG